MRKSYKFRLYPTKEQELVLVKTLDVCRYIYNEFLADRRNAYDRCNQGLTTFDQITQVKYLEFNTEVFSQIKQDVLRRLGKSFDAFFRRCRSGETPGYPRSQRTYRGYMTSHKQGDRALDVMTANRSLRRSPENRPLTRNRWTLHR